MQQNTSERRGVTDRDAGAVATTPRLQATRARSLEGFARSARERAATAMQLAANARSHARQHERAGEQAARELQDRTHGPRARFALESRRAEAARLATWWRVEYREALAKAAKDEERAAALQLEADACRAWIRED